MGQMAQTIMYVQIAFSVGRASTLREATEDASSRAGEPVGPVPFAHERTTLSPSGGEGRGEGAHNRDLHAGFRLASDGVFRRHGNPPLSQHDNLAIRQLASAPPTDPWQAICLTEKGRRNAPRSYRNRTPTLVACSLSVTTRALAESKTRRSVPAKRAAM